MKFGRGGIRKFLAVVAWIPPLSSSLGKTADKGNN